MIECFCVEAENEGELDFAHLLHSKEGLCRVGMWDRGRSVRLIIKSSKRLAARIITQTLMCLEMCNRLITKLRNHQVEVFFCSNLFLYLKRVFMNKVIEF